MNYTRRGCGWAAIIHRLTRIKQPNVETNLFPGTARPTPREGHKMQRDARDPGGRLKQVRMQLGMTTREVALFSKSIALAEANNEFLLSSPWLTQIENDKTAVPSIYKLFT